MFRESRINAIANKLDDTLQKILLLKDLLKTSESEINELKN